MGRSAWHIYIILCHTCYINVYDHGWIKIVILTSRGPHHLFTHIMLLTTCSPTLRGRPLFPAHRSVIGLSLSLSLVYLCLCRCFSLSLLLVCLCRCRWCSSVPVVGVHLSISVCQWVGCGPLSGIVWGAGPLTGDGSCPSFSTRNWLELISCYCVRNQRLLNKMMDECEGWGLNPSIDYYSKWPYEEY